MTDDKDSLRIELMLNSLNGLWVGDCIGNIGQLYYAHDILKALDEGIMKFGADNINPMAQHFQYSDDTEEAIVLVNHMFDRHETMTIDQDVLAKEFAVRYYDRDPDGELYGYGLMTRKVLKEIYDGKPWREANQTKQRIEGPSFVDKLVSQAAQGKSLTAAMAEVNADIKLKMEKEPNMKVGSCGNGSAMRVAPLGAWFNLDQPEKVVEMATSQSVVTHCHPEGIAGAVAVAMMSYMICEWKYNLTAEYHRGWGLCDVGEKTKDTLYDILLDYVPEGQVYNGIVKARDLPLDTPIAKLIEILGNGTHVTCQDTVPLCIFLTIRGLVRKESYETVLIETCKCFGDVDTNCAIVGGMVGIISPPPEKWMRYCQPMEGVLGEPFPEKPRKPIQSKLGFDIDKDGVKSAMQSTQPWGWNAGIGNSNEEDWNKSTIKSEVVGGKPQPTFEEVFEERKKLYNGV